MNQLAEKAVQDEVREYLASHDRNDPAVMATIRGWDQCRQQAEFVRFLCEEFAVPMGKELEEMPRTGSGHLRRTMTDAVRVKITRK